MPKIHSDFIDDNIIKVTVVSIMMLALVGVVFVGGDQTDPSADIDVLKTEGVQVDTTNDGEFNPDTQTYEVRLELQSVDGDIDGPYQITVTSDDPVRVVDSSDDPNSSVSELQPSGDEYIQGNSAELLYITSGDTITVTGEQNGEQVELWSYTIE